MFKKLSVMLITGLILSLSLYGCGSGKKGGESTTNVEPATTVGVDVCVNCHSIQGGEWIDSRHANSNSSPTGRRTEGRSLFARR
jgi:hypothetical protein